MYNDIVSTGTLLSFDSTCFANNRRRFITCVRPFSEGEEKIFLDFVGGRFVPGFHTCRASIFRESKKRTKQKKRKKKGNGTTKDKDVNNIVDDEEDDDDACDRAGNLFIQATRSAPIRANAIVRIDREPEIFAVRCST